ncbi:ATP-binding protein [Catalinimonas sp. 4WD22]|uniref:ATP-binding protein n=1 Tax=Catalinimonas locisalis TaxID=3133978 RepID=UPI0031019BFA
MADLESQHLDYKQSWQDEHLKTLCAFANAEGGEIHLGKDDQGKITPLEQPKKLLESLPGKIIQKLGVYPRLDLVQEEEQAFIVIRIEASPLPVGLNGRYYKRIGSTNQELKGPMLSQFLMEKSGNGWDELPEPQATLKDLDVNTLQRFQRFASERVPSIRQEPLKTDKDLLSFLQKLNLAEGGMLSRAAILLFGKEPQRYYRDAYLKIGMFASDAELLSDDHIKGNLFNQVEQGMEVLKLKYLVPKVYYEGIVRKEKAEYPESALREAIINALVHRDYAGPPLQISVYDDKMILWNEGGLPATLTIEDLKHKHPSRPRNRSLSDVFYKAGYIESWGRGTIAITQDCIRAGLPEPAFREAFGGLEVTFFKNTLTEEQLAKLPINDRQRQAIQYLKEYSRISNKDYQELTNCSRNTASNDLKELVSLKIIMQAGRKGAGSYYVLR